MSLNYEKISSAYVTINGVHIKTSKIFEVINGVWQLKYRSYIKIEQPTYSGSLIYTGNIQSPNWIGYDSNCIDIDGTSGAIDVGTYTTTFTPKKGYCWMDESTTSVSLTWSIGKATISTVPSQSGKLYYTGNSISPTWSNYDNSQLTISGTTSATNIGTYNATFTPKSNYQWSDGTTTIKTVTWRITDNWPNILQDFTYTENSDGTATITDWKQTLNGSSSTELVVPDNPRIIL